MFSVDLNVFWHIQKYFLGKWPKHFSFCSWLQPPQWTVYRPTKLRLSVPRCMFPNILFSLPSRFFLFESTWKQLSLFNLACFSLITKSTFTIPLSELPIFHIILCGFLSNYFLTASLVLLTRTDWFFIPTILMRQFDHVVVQSPYLIRPPYLIKL